MCVSTPEVPEVPDRQAARAPDGGEAGVRADDKSKRRMAFAASILSGPGGTLGAPSTTANLGG